MELIVIFYTFQSENFSGPKYPPRGRDKGRGMPSDLTLTLASPSRGGNFIYFNFFTFPFSKISGATYRCRRHFYPHHEGDDEDDRNRRPGS
jgi:hypothetical protein